MRVIFSSAVLGTLALALLADSTPTVPVHHYYVSSGRSLRFTKPLQIHMPEHGSQNQARRDSDTDSQSFVSEEPWPSRIIRPGGTSIQAASSSSDGQYLWDTYDSVLSKMRYIDLTHTITPDIPIWRGFGNITFSQAVSKLTEQPFEYAKDKFVATAYKLTTDQMGTQLDAPAHFNPYYAASDEMPATFALRKLVVIDMSAQVLKNSSYALSVADVLDWEKQHGRIPAMSVVFVRSDWSKAWPYVNTDVFPQVSLEAVQFLHLKRNILFHGHEPLDADMTPNFDAEAWALRNGYAQAEGVTNLHLVPPTGCLLSTGFPKFAGGVGNYVRYVAVCPSEWKHGVVPGATPEAPLPKFVNPLVWNEEKGRRVRALSQKAIV